MLLANERKEIVNYGVKLMEDHMTTGTSGNISIYEETTGLIAISPSGIDYRQTKPEDIVVVNRNGEIVDGKRIPSSELALHTQMYQSKKNIHAIVHCHSMYATIISILKEPLKAYHYVIADAGAYEIPCVPYVTFGTQELAQTVTQYCKEANAAIMANHGQIACGKDIESAYGLAVNVEFLAELQYKVKAIGPYEPLSHADMEKVFQKIKDYGQSEYRND